MTVLQGHLLPLTEHECFPDPAMAKLCVHNQVEASLSSEDASKLRFEGLPMSLPRNQLTTEYAGA